MITIDFSNKELETLIQSLRERESIMFNQSLIYKNQDNKLAQMDCIQEWRIAQHLRERLEKITTK
jgi:hypothetical protein